MEVGQGLNSRYKVREIEFSGTIHEVGESTPYGGGQGTLRNVVLCVDGMFNTLAYVPVTVFNEYAESLDPARDRGRGITCTASIQTRQYLDRNGVPRWSVSFPAFRMNLAPISVSGVSSGRAGETAGPQEEDDIPF